MGMMGNVQSLAAMGQGGDTMLAHINPREAMMLKMMGGSGTVNPRTGLMQFFTPEEYLRLYPDVAKDPYFGANPQAHWEQYGQKEGRSSGDPPQTGGGEPQPPAGGTGGLMGGGVNQVSYEDIDYLNRYQDVAKSGMSAQEHYNKYGKTEGRRYGVQTGGGEPVPSWLQPGSTEKPPVVQTGGAVTTTPSATTGGGEPYQAPGGAQTFGYAVPTKPYSSGVNLNNLEPNQVDSAWKAPVGWDPAKYLRENPDLANDPWATANPLAHYALFGTKEGRQWGTGGYANTNFKNAGGIYLANNEDVKNSKMDPWEHYQKYGKAEGRKWYGEEQNSQTYLLYTDKDFKANPGWDPVSFLKMHPELKDNAWAQANPLAYAALFGKDMATPTFSRATPVDFGKGKFGVEGAKVLTQQLSEDGKTRRSYLSNGTFVDNTWDPNNTHILGQEDRGGYWLIYTDDGSYTTVAKEGTGGIWGQATKIFQAPAKWTLEGLGGMFGGNNDFTKMANKLEANEKANSWGAMINSIIEPTQTTGLFAGGTGRVLPKEMKEGIVPQVIEGIAGIVYPVVGPMAISGLVSQFNEENQNEAWTKAGIKGGASYAAGAISPYVSSAASFAGTELSAAAAQAISTAIVTTAVQKGIYNQSWEDSIKAGVIAGTINYVGGKLVGKFKDAYGNIINLGANGEPSLEASTEFMQGSQTGAGQSQYMLPQNPLEGMGEGLTYANATPSSTPSSVLGYGGYPYGGGSFESLSGSLQYGQPSYQSPLANSSYFSTEEPLANMRNLYYQNNMPANFPAELTEGLQFAQQSSTVPPFEYGGGNLGLGSLSANLEFGQQPYVSPLEGTMFGPGGGLLQGYPGIQSWGAGAPFGTNFGSQSKIPVAELLKAAVAGFGGAGSAGGGATKKGGAGEGGGPNGGLLSLDEMPIPEYMKKKLKRKAMAAGKTWQEYLADATRGQKSYYGAYLA